MQNYAKLAAIQNKNYLFIFYYKKANQQLPMKLSFSKNHTKPKNRNSHQRIAVIHFDSKQATYCN